MRKRTGMLLTIGILCSLLAGCGKVDGTQPAITVNGETLSLGTATYDLRYQQAETMYSMSMFGMVSEGASFWEREITAEEGEETRTYGDSVKESVKETLVQMMLLKQHAADYDLELPAEVTTAAESAAKEAYSKNASVLSPAGVSEENIREFLTLSAYSSLLYDAMTADVDVEVSDDEAKQSSITYARLSATPAETTEEGAEEAEEETADPKATMEEYLKALQAEEDPAAADMEALKDGIDEAITVSTYSFGEDEAYLSEEVQEAARALQDGGVHDGVVESADGNYYVIRMDAVFDEEATQSKKESIVQTRKQEAYTALLDTWKEEAEVTTGEAWDALTMTDHENWVVKTS